MQFNVRYVPYQIQFYGKGSVFFNDTALIFEGSITKFPLPLIQFFYQNVILVKTIKTVPYSTIFNYKKISLNCCQIGYRLPDVKKTGMQFFIEQKKTKVFLNKLEEYMTTVKNL
ncbi:hypothetical protein [Okeania sp. SIO2B3]|uniref:hypothetical protein n=1 Tax=Okeania sp. SIO2B3 TaxID=2607784 RepID=UPI0013C07A7D|nr:hypothetical protein [Okeania sp. SIO2B3]NET43152.1 hypothetical protein [Okeania sp. SIO2B3]